MKKINCKNYGIYINDWNSFREKITQINPSNICILVDENTEKFCLPHMLENLHFEARVIRIPSGEQNKTIQTCQDV